MLSLTSGCSQFFFYPQKTLLRTPSDIGLNYEDVQLTTTDQVRLHGWLLKADQSKAIVLFLHGNAENISTHIGSVYWLPEHGYDVFLLDYRGFGQSEGTPGFPEIYWDTATAYEWVINYAKENNVKLFVLGQSLGAASVSYYFSQLPDEQRAPDGIVLDSVFASHADIAKAALSGNWLTWPFQFVVPFFLPSEYSPVDHVAKISPVPLLFFHSPEDQIVPIEQGQRVYAAAQTPKAWVTSQGPHIATFNYQEYQRKLLDFFEALENGSSD